MNEIETLKLTLKELNERIAGLRGIRMSMVVTCPNYTGDMNLATELFWDLPGGIIYSNCIVWNYLNCTKQHRKDDLAVAICLAWLQWETGETVELTQD